MKPLRRTRPLQFASICLAAVVLFQSAVVLADRAGPAKPCDRGPSHCGQAAMKPGMDCCAMGETCSSLNLILFQTVPNSKTKQPKITAMKPVHALRGPQPLQHRPGQCPHHQAVHKPACGKLYQINESLLR